MAAPSERWMYLPVASADVGLSARVLVRASGDVSALLAALPRALTNIDRAVPIYDVRTLSRQLEGTLGTPRLLALLGELFGGLALLLVVLGLYGLLTGLVSGRVNEIGVRLVLGARRSSVAWLVAREAVMVVVPGLGVGVLGALGAARFVRAQLFGITPTDLSTIAGAVAILLAAAGLAVWFPTRRATGVDPTVTLRCQ